MLLQEQLLPSNKLSHASRVSSPRPLSGTVKFVGKGTFHRLLATPMHSFARWREPTGSAVASGRPKYGNEQLGQAAVRGA
jgi:hypothetical protein